MANDILYNVSCMANKTRTHGFLRFVARLKILSKHIHGLVPLMNVVPSLKHG